MIWIENITHSQCFQCEVLKDYMCYVLIEISNILQALYKLNLNICTRSECCVLSVHIINLLRQETFSDRVTHSLINSSTPIGSVNCSLAIGTVFVRKVFESESQLNANKISTLN